MFSTVLECHSVSSFTRCGIASRSAAYSPCWAIWAASELHSFTR